MSLGCPSLQEVREEDWLLSASPLSCFALAQTLLA